MSNNKKSLIMDEKSLKNVRGGNAPGSNPIATLLQTLANERK